MKFTSCIILPTILVALVSFNDAGSARPSAREVQAARDISKGMEKNVSDSRYQKRVCSYTSQLDDRRFTYLPYSNVLLNPICKSTSTFSKTQLAIVIRYISDVGSNGDMTPTPLRTQKIYFTGFAKTCGNYLSQRSIQPIKNIITWLLNDIRIPEIRSSLGVKNTVNGISFYSFERGCQ